MTTQTRPTAGYRLALFGFAAGIAVLALSLIFKANVLTGPGPRHPQGKVVHVEVNADPNIVHVGAWVDSDVRGRFDFPGTPGEHLHLYTSPVYRVAPGETVTVHLVITVDAQSYRKRSATGRIYVDGRKLADGNVVSFAPSEGGPQAPRGAQARQITWVVSA